MEEKKNIGSLFDRIAKHYDSLNHLLSLNIDKRWRRQAVGEIAQSASERELLDVAIGTADLSLEVLRQHPSTKITGIDLSEQMMLLGKEKVRKAGKSERVEFMKASALDMPFDDGRFDVVTCAYGVRNFSDLDQGLREMYRVLRERGEVVILEFSYPTNAVIRFFYDLYFSYIMPLIGRWFSKDKTAYAYLRSSVKSFVWGEQMVERMRKAGFSNISFKPQTAGISTVYVGYKGAEDDQR